MPTYIILVMQITNKWLWFPIFVQFYSILNQFLLAHVKNGVKALKTPCASNHSLHHADTSECRILERRTWGGVRGQVVEEILFGGVIFLDVNAGCEE